MVGARHASSRQITCPCQAPPPWRRSSPEENHRPIRRPQAPWGGAQVRIADAGSRRWEKPKPEDRKLPSSLTLWRLVASLLGNSSGWGRG